MPDPVTALIGGGASLISGAIGSSAQKKASSQAAGAQTEASMAAIDEQRRQFEAVQELLKPYVEAGTSAIGQQQALLGLSGQEAQQQAISQIEAGPQFQALQQQGENALLQNASATGGLRGGNLKSALSRYRPQLLSDLINQQYQQLGGLSQIGQASAAGQAYAAQNLAANVGQQFGNIGAAQAGQALAQGQATAGLAGNIGGLAAQGAILSGLGVF